MIRIIGRNKCNDTKKALRFFKERGIKVQFQNLDERELTSGELENIFKLLKPDTLLDTFISTTQGSPYVSNLTSNKI